MGKVKTDKQIIKELRTQLKDEKQQSKEYKDMLGEQVQKVQELGEEEEKQRGKKVRYRNKIAELTAKLSTMAEEAKEQGKELETRKSDYSKLNELYLAFKDDHAISFMEIRKLKKVIVKQAIQLADN